MEHQSKLVSIIMPTYNSTDTVVESIQSVLSQTYKNWELIIVDDRSTDNTWQVIQTYADKYDNIRVYQNKENLGAGASRNFAIKKQKAALLLFWILTTFGQKTN